MRQASLSGQLISDEESRRFISRGENGFDPSTVLRAGRLIVERIVCRSTDSAVTSGDDIGRELHLHILPAGHGGLYAFWMQVGDILVDIRLPR